MDQRFGGGHGGSCLQERDDTTDRGRPLLIMVDDDPHDRRIYGSMLCYNGYDVVLASCVADGLNAASHHRADLVLLDVGLPDGSGLEICSELRRRAEYDGVPILALSGFPRAQQGQLAADAGCTRYLEKPLSPVEVLHQVEELIGRAPLPGEGPPPRVIG